MYKLWNALNESKKYKWVELSHPLNNDSPVWSGIPEGSVELGKVEVVEQKNLDLIFILWNIGIMEIF